MSGIFGKIFGEKNKKPEVTTQGALQSIAGMEELLIKKQEHISKQIENVLQFYYFYLF